VSFVLNTQKGSTINHPLIKLKGGIAYEVSEHVANQLKHIMNIVIFDEVRQK